VLTCDVLGDRHRCDDIACCVPHGGGPDERHAAAAIVVLNQGLLRCNHFPRGEAAHQRALAHGLRSAVKVPAAGEPADGGNMRVAGTPHDCQRGRRAALRVQHTTRGYSSSHAMLHGRLRCTPIPGQTLAASCAGSHDGACTRHDGLRVQNTHAVAATHMGTAMKSSRVLHSGLRKG